MNTFNGSDEWRAFHCLRFDQMVVEQGLDIVDTGQNRCVRISVIQKLFGIICSFIEEIHESLREKSFFLLSNPTCIWWWKIRSCSTLQPLISCPSRD